MEGKWHKNQVQTTATGWYLFPGARESWRT